MSPVFAQLIIFGLQELIVKAPAIAAELKSVMSKDNPTHEDFEALRKRVESADYFKFVPNSDLKK